MTDIVERLRQWQVFYREEPARMLPRRDLSCDIGEAADDIMRLREWLSLERGRADDARAELTSETTHMNAEIDRLRAEVERLTAPVTGEIGWRVARLQSHAEYLDTQKLSQVGDFIRESAAALQRLAQENAWLEDADRIHAGVGKAREERMRGLEAERDTAVEELNHRVTHMRNMELRVNELESERDAARSLNTEMREALTFARRLAVTSCSGISDGMTIHDIRQWIERADAILLKTEPEAQ